MSLTIQKQIEIAIFQNDTERINKLSSVEAPDFYTVKYAIDRARKFSNTYSRATLKLVLSKVTLSQDQKRHLKEVILWDMGTQVNAILKSYV